MANYVEKARAVLVAMAASADQAATTPPAAAEVGQHSGNADTARREIWMGWCEWKAAALNRLFQEQGTSGQPSHITAATVRHGEGKTGGAL